MAGSATSEGDAEGQPNAPSEGIELDQTIKDQKLGDVIKVLGLVRHFPDEYSAIQDRDIVLVHVELSPGSKFTGGLGPSGFRVITPGGEVYTSTTIVRPQMKEAGYKPIPYSVHSGETAEGYIAFVIEPEGAKSLKFRHKRLAATVIGSGEKIPAKTFVVPRSRGHV